MSESTQLALLGLEEAREELEERGADEDGGAEPEALTDGGTPENGEPPIPPLAKYISPWKAKNDGEEPAQAADPYPIADLAPMLRQYREMKLRYSEHLLLFQVGDFYEIFFEDARIASDVLSIRLTSRDKNNPNPIPMCGVPIHAVDNYLQRILAAGLSCVLISQVEDETNKKTGIRREVSRIITPGVRFDSEGLDEKRFNYLATAAFGPRGGAVSFIDVSTGHLRLNEVESIDDLLEALERIRPAEIVLPSSVDGSPVDKHEKWMREVKKAQANCHFVQRPYLTTRDFAERAKALGCEELPNIERISIESLLTLQALLNYVEEISCGKVAKLAQFSLEDNAKTVFIDGATRRNLELVESRLEGSRKGSLLYHIDLTKTAMGGRLLSDWILLPSAAQGEVVARHDAVQEFLECGESLEGIREVLVRVRDLDRLLARVTSLRANPRDLAALRDSIEPLPALSNELAKMTSMRLAEMARRLDTLEDIGSRLQSALLSEPSVPSSPATRARHAVLNAAHQALRESLREKFRPRSA